MEYPDEADLVLINTCGFIRPAVEESLSTLFDTLGRISDIEVKPVLAVTGCLVSRYAQNLATEIPEVDIWLDTHSLEQWPERIAAALGRHPSPYFSRKLSTGPSYAYLKISEGCSHSCAFCTIPSIRGAHKSREMYSLLEEAQELVQQGVPELIVVAQDVAAYGSDLGLDNALPELVENLASVQGLEWLRLMYLYPAGLSEQNLSFLAGIGRPFLPYFDVPLQHSHPDILRSMGRPFAKDPRIIVDRIRKYFPDAALRTSIITGYPGESDEHFASLCDFVRDLRFQHLGVFAYQQEEGTVAAELPKQVPEAVREERREQLMRIQAEISAELLEQTLGQHMEVLVQAPSDEWEGLFIARTWFQAPEVDGITYLSSSQGQALLPGSIVNAEIYEAKTYDLVALAD